MSNGKDYECTECGHTFHADYEDGCPECGGVCEEMLSGIDELHRLLESKDALLDGFREAIDAIYKALGIDADVEMQPTEKALERIARLAAQDAALELAREALGSSVAWLKRVEIERPELYWAIMRETGMMFPLVELEAAIDAAREAR